MGTYRRMGNVEQHLGNTTSTMTLLHYQLTDLWRSPRGTVLRIEALALVAIALSFFLAAFGSCRRWSNRWIIQKGFLAAQVLSLSLGTYSIGLMQSSSVKSEMYPIWAVSLLTLFGCVDPVTTYNGLDYKGPLSKMIFQLCLYCGYVLLMSVSAISSVVGNLAIGVLTAITFFKGFHRSMALVLPSKTRDQLGQLRSTETGALAGYGERLAVHLPLHLFQRGGGHMKLSVIKTKMADIHSSCNEMQGKLRLKEITANRMTIEDVCLGYSLSHLSQRRFLGLDTAEEMERKRESFRALVQQGRPIDYKRTLKAVEVELAFLYDVFFTSNEFLHYSEAKTSSFWALASFIGICCVGVVTAIPGTMTSRHTVTSGSVVSVVDTTPADLIITLVILMSLALLQLVQLMRCWTSNWARVAFACEYTIRNQKYDTPPPSSWWRWMRLKGFVVTRMSWFEDKYLWQDKLGQYSVVDAVSSTRASQGIELPLHMQLLCICPASMLGCVSCTFYHFPRLLGLPYFGQVLRELLLCDTNRGVKLHEDVKTSIVDLLGNFGSRRLTAERSSLFVENGIGRKYHPNSFHDAYAFTRCVMMWHIATCYCELAEQEGSTAGGGGDSSSSSSHHADTTDREKHRRVAISLSKYWAYLMVSAPELLPGPVVETKRAFSEGAKSARLALGGRGNKLQVMQQLLPSGAQEPPDYDHDDVFLMGVYWGRRLRNEAPLPPGPGSTRRRRSDHWEVLALLWVETLLSAAPYGDVQRHLQHLSQGGEFITHLWALLYHIGVDRGTEDYRRRAEDDAGKWTQQCSVM